MMKNYQITSWLKPMLLLLSGLIILVIFEAYQQSYYITKFNLALQNEIQVSDLILNHFRRWILWLLAGIPLSLYVFKNPFKSARSQYLQIFRFLAIILVTLLTSILLITASEMVISDSKNFTEDLRFFFFQKGPIYLFAYAGLAVLIHLFLSTRSLNLKIHELRTLKTVNQSLYKELKSQSYEDEMEFIQVKIGKRNKIVPLDNIRWIEADDYCVKLHTRNNESYVLRSSMKSMENLLPKNKFVRIHRQSIVNLADVDEFLFINSPEVLLSDGQKLPVAQSRIKEIKRLLTPAEV